MVKDDEDTDGSSECGMDLMMRPREANDRTLATRGGTCAGKWRSCTCRAPRKMFLFASAEATTNGVLAAVCLKGRILLS